MKRRNALLIVIACLIVLTAAYLLLREKASDAVSIIELGGTALIGFYFGMRSAEGKKSVLIALGVTLLFIIVCLKVGVPITELHNTCTGAWCFSQGLSVVLGAPISIIAALILYPLGKIANKKLIEQSNDNVHSLTLLYVFLAIFSVFFVIFIVDYATCGSIGIRNTTFCTADRVLAGAPVQSCGEATDSQACYLWASRWFLNSSRCNEFPAQMQKTCFLVQAGNHQDPAYCLTAIDFTVRDDCLLESASYARDTSALQQITDPVKRDNALSTYATNKAVNAR